MKKPVKIKTINPMYRDTEPEEGFRNCWSEATYAAWIGDDGEVYIGIMYCMTEESGEKSAWLCYPDEDDYVPDITDMKKLDEWERKEEIPIALYDWTVYSYVSPNQKGELIDRGLLSEDEEIIPF